MNIVSEFRYDIHFPFHFSETTPGQRVATRTVATTTGAEATDKRRVPGPLPAHGTFLIRSDPPHSDITIRTVHYNTKCCFFFKLREDASATKAELKSVEKYSKT